MVPLKLAPVRPVSLGQLPIKPIVRVKTQDDDGRPVPGVEIQVNIENGRPESSWKYNVGIDGVSAVDLPDVQRGDVLILGPSLPLEMVSDPPFERIEVGQEIPEEFIFTIAPRRPERDLISPIVSFTLGGIITAIAVYYLIGKKK